jgi:hypothetical protein
MVWHTGRTPRRDVEHQPQAALAPTGRDLGQDRERDRDVHDAAQTPGKRLPTRRTLNEIVETIDVVANVRL